jgi:4-amino-4-deoxy-L-arabinose transferase-like glycosyltransferase
MASEIKAQEFVHTLEHGRGRWWIGLLLILAFAAFQTVSHVFINPMNRQGGQMAIFVGLSHPKGMEQAVIARELARGRGFSTTVIKPAAIDLVEKNKGDGAFTAFLDPNGPTHGAIPDYYHAPLNPWINSIALRVVAAVSDAFNVRVDAKGRNDFWPLYPGEYVHPSDRTIALVSALFFLGAVALSFLTARMLFDERLATLSVVLLLFCNQFWEFSSTGLPQMLMLFLFSAAIYLLTRALAARGGSRRLWHLHAGVGLCFGLLALAHPLTAFLFGGALVFAAVAFRPFGRAAYIMLAVFLVCISPWLMRNQQVCGSAFGLGARTVTVGLRGSESQIMRTLSKPNEDVPPTHFRVKIQGQLNKQLDQLYGHLGAIVAAPIFFLSLLHAFRKRETRSLRWGVLAMLLSGMLGMAIFGFNDDELQANLDANDLYPLFIPPMTAYGLGLVLVMWSRVQIMGREVARIRQVNVAFLSLIVLISGFPLLSTYTDPPRIPFVWPPYCPPVLKDLSDWYLKDDIICSDMPWAVSWYADRKSLWLPLTISDFSDLSDFRFFGKITGLLVTPMTGFRGMLSEVSVGEFKDWRAFIMRDPRAAANFPLKVARPMFLMGASHYLLFADRDRWTERNN